MEKLTAMLKEHPAPWRFLKVMNSDGVKSYFPYRNDTSATKEELAELDCGYGRLSNGILDANGKCVLVTDPSEGEYAGFPDEIAEAFVELVNDYEILRSNHAC